jgi:predicted GNAT superfamily acetyltransferase
MHIPSFVTSLQNIHFFFWSRSIRAYHFIVFSDEFPVAFCHFRFELEEMENVLYLYEIQLTPPFRGRGLGRFLLTLMEGICRKTGMIKVMLTVQTKNTKAQQFYAKCGFEIDPSSPIGKEATLEGYKILCKVVTDISSNSSSSPTSSNQSSVVNKKVKKRKKEVL